MYQVRSSVGLQERMEQPEHITLASGIHLSGPGALAGHQTNSNFSTDFWPQIQLVNNLDIDR